MVWSVNGVESVSDCPRGKRDVFLINAPTVQSCQRRLFPGDAALFSASCGAAGDLFPWGRGAGGSCPHSFVCLDNDSLTIWHLSASKSPHFSTCLKFGNSVHPLRQGRTFSSSLHHQDYGSTGSTANLLSVSHDSESSVSPLSACMPC